MFYPGGCASLTEVKDAMANTFEKYKDTILYKDKVDVDSFRKILACKHSPCSASRYFNAGDCPQFAVDIFTRGAVISVYQQLCIIGAFSVEYVCVMGLPKEKHIWPVSQSWFWKAQLRISNHALIRHESVLNSLAFPPKEQRQFGTGRKPPSSL